MPALQALRIALCASFLALGAAATGFSVDGPGGAIPDPAGTPGTWNVAFTGNALRSGAQVAQPVERVSSIVLHGLRHSWRGDLHVWLESPAGARFELVVRPGSDGTSAGDFGDFVLGEFTLVPSGGASLQQGGANLVSGNYAPWFNAGTGAWTNGSASVGLDSIHGPAGTWTLVLEDWAQMDTGALAGWTFSGIGAEPGRAFCTGDGLDPNITSACPCANHGASGHGCANSATSAGGLLAASGTTVPDTLVLRAQELPATSAALFLQGDAFADEVFGDGVRCIGGALVRLRARTCVAGVVQFPLAGDPSLATRGGVVPGGGALRCYQVHYRNAAAAFCPPATFNVTNGWIVVW